MKKRIFSFAIALTMAFSLCTAAFAFSDISGSWAETTIQKWKDEARVFGYPDGTFRPNESVTRAELIHMAVPLFGFASSAEPSFRDVLPGAWYYEQVGAALAAGFISGYPDGTFGPNDPISRQEIALIVTSILGISTDHLVLPFSDADKIANWSARAIAAAYDNGLMFGFSLGDFRPHAQATRAEALVLLERAYKLWVEQAGLKRTLDQAGTYGPANGSLVWPSDVTITSPDVVLRNVVVEGDVWIDASLKEDDYSFQHVTIVGTIKIIGGDEPEQDEQPANEEDAAGRPDETLDPAESPEQPSQDDSEKPNEDGDEARDEDENSDEPADNEPPEQPADDETPDETKPPADEEPSDGHPSDEDPSDKDPADEEPIDEDPSDEEPSDEEPSDEQPADEQPSSEDPADEEPIPSEPLVVLSASASIGGSSVSASMDGNTGKVSASSFSDSDSISGLSIQTSSNVDRIEVSAYGISRTISLTNGSASISVGDLLGPIGDGVTIGAVRMVVGSSFSIGGTLIGKDGTTESFTIEISL